MEGRATKSGTNPLLVVLFVLILILGSLRTTRHLESLDFGLNSSFALFVTQSWFLVLE